MNVFDLRGPEFLKFYFCLLCLTYFAALLLRWYLRGPGGDMSHLVASLDFSEAAYLAGGPKMVVDAALAGLVHGGALKLDKTRGRFTVAGAMTGEPSWIERAVFGLVERGNDSVSALHRSAKSLTAEMAQRLRNANLVLEPGEAIITQVGPALLMSIVVFVGIAKISIGLSRGKPIAFLVFLTVIGAFSTLSLAFRPVRRTRAGDRMMSRLRSKNSALRMTIGTAPHRVAQADLALAIALWGPTILHSGDLLSLRQTLWPVSSSSGSGCGSGEAGAAAEAGAAVVVAAAVEEDDMNFTVLDPVQLGLGIGWRPELALDIERRAGLGFVEVVAENIDPDAIPKPLLKLREAGKQIIPHGISLSLGGAEPIDRAGGIRLRDLARRLDSPLVSEHIAFVRAGGIEAGHLLPLPRTKTAIRVLIDNVKRAQDLLDTPLALENISALFEWPDAEMSDAEFVCEILEKTGTGLLLDVANVWANARNLGGDPVAFLRQLPLERIAYVHVAGGEERNGTYHDSQSAAVPPGVLELLETLCRMTPVPGVMLERDDDFPDASQLNHELDAIAATIASGHGKAIPAR